MWTSYGPSAGQALKLGRKKSVRYSRMLSAFRSRTWIDQSVAEAEPAVRASARAVSVGPDRVSSPGPIQQDEMA